MLNTHALSHIGRLPDKIVNLPCYDIVPDKDQPRKFRLQATDRVISFDPNALSEAEKLQFEKYVPTITDLIATSGNDQHFFLGGDLGAPIAQLDGKDYNVSFIATLVADKFTAGSEVTYFPTGLAPID